MNVGSLTSKASEGAYRYESNGRERKQREIGKIINPLGKKSEGGREGGDRTFCLLNRAAGLKQKTRQTSGSHETAGPNPKNSNACLGDQRREQALERKGKR